MPHYEICFKHLGTLGKLKHQINADEMTYHELAIAANALGISERVIPDPNWKPCNLEIGSFWPLNKNYQVFWRRV